MEHKPQTDISTLGEFGLIRHLTENFPPRNASTLKGVGDDAAVLALPKPRRTLVTPDLRFEGIHFDLTYVPLKHHGYKSAVVNFSDHYALNGRPARLPSRWDSPNASRSKIWKSCMPAYSWPATSTASTW